ncbi:hypothetical protein L7F22_024765 [Adiantum nelumboides]|nr:hypothetical protein [Adiantum nelumboides]
MPPCKQSNYQTAGGYLHVDLVNNPGLLSTDPNLSFKSAIWFWMKAGTLARTCHSAIVNQLGFGPTTRIINGIECNGAHPNEQQDRVDLYLSFCGTFGISCAKQLYC